jgi:hypothetical protein
LNSKAPGAVELNLYANVELNLYAKCKQISGVIYRVEL